MSTTTSVTYTTTMNVCVSWDELKKTPNYQKVAGELIFERLFLLQPEAKVLFGFNPVESIKENPKFNTHAAAMVDMIDCAIALLGPDLDPLEEHFAGLGRRHLKYGVKAEYLPLMGQAVLFAMQSVLGPKFTFEDMKDWIAVFDLIISKMRDGMK